MMELKYQFLSILRASLISINVWSRDMFVENMLLEGGRGDIVMQKTSALNSFS